MLKVYSKLVFKGLFFAFFAAISIRSTAQCSNLDFAASTRKGCIPLVVHFKALNFASGSTFQWNLQGSNVSGKDTITWVYLTAGTFKIQMIATPSSWAPCPTVVKDTFITVLPIPVPDMRISTGLTVCNGAQPVLFGDSTANDTSSEWIIEGHSLKGKKISYLFSGRGTIPVVLKVTNKEGCTGYATPKLKVSDTVPVDMCASFNVNTPTNQVGKFTPQVGAYANRTIKSYNWRFPGGLPSSATTTKPDTVQVTYADIKLKHDVSLTIVMSDGCTYTIYRKGFVSPFLLPSFYKVCAGHPFAFTGDASDTGRHYYNFNFSGASSVYIPPVLDPHSGTLDYDIPGNYTASISYKFKGLGCRITINYPRFLTVIGPKANFTSKDRQICKLTDTVHFINMTDTLLAGKVKYTWYILDSGTLPPPRKVLKKFNTTYTRDTFFSPSILGTNPGRVFSVVLVATGSTGCTDSLVMKNFIQEDIPKSNFETAPLSCYDKPGGTKLVAKPTPAGTSFNYAYNWKIWYSKNYDDSFIASGPVAFFNPDMLGTYDVYLKISNGHCFGDTFKRMVLNTIGDSCDFSANPRIGCMSPGFVSTLSVTKKETLNPDDPNHLPIYLWKCQSYDQFFLSFENPNAKTTRVFINKAGCYDIFLDIMTIVGADTCIREIFKPSYLCPGAGIAFRVDDMKCPGDTINVDNFSKPTAFNLKWIVEPKGYAVIWPNDTAKKIKIIFNVDTCYTIKLIGSNIVAGNLCTDTIIASGVCMPQYKPDILSTSPPFYCAPSIGMFYETQPNPVAVDGPAKYLWFFGDGDSLLTTNDSVTHVYNRLLKSNYDIKLKVFYANGCVDTITKSNIVSVIGPIPNFTEDKKAGCDSMLVQFTNTSQNVKTFYFFYGDGTPALTTNPGKHRYVIQDASLDSVTYYPTLIETDDTVCKVYYKDSIKVYKTPDDAKINTDQSLGCVPFAVHFHAISKLGNRWRWDFDGDGIIDDSVHKDPVFTYKKPGSYHPSLIISYQGSCPYTVRGSPVVAVPSTIGSLVAYPSKFCGSQTINFNYINTGAVKYIFDYGDGSTPDTNHFSKHLYTYNPVNNITDSSHFKPQIIAINAAGCVDTFSTFITGFASPKIGFSISQDSGCSPLKVHFSDTSSFRFSSAWDFDNNGTKDAFSKETDKVFTSGFYSPKLITTSIHGCVDSLIKLNSVHVNSPPKANFNASDSIVCYKNLVQFTNLTKPPTHITSWHWIFDDTLAPNPKSSSKDPLFRFYAPGWHTVELIAIDDKGCSDTIQKKSVFVDDTIPPKPDSLLYVSVIDTNMISVVWRKSNTTLFKSYRVNRLENGKAVEVFNGTSLHDTSFTENSPKINTSGNSYCYNIQIINACGRISNPSPVHCTILLHETAMLGPTNLLTWTPYIGWKPIYYRIYREDPYHAFKIIDSVNGSLLSYTDSNLCDGTYCYYVEAMSANGYASKSNITCLQTLYVKIVNPLNLRYTTTTNDREIKVEWDTVSNRNLSSYLLDRYTTTTGWAKHYVFTKNNSFIDGNVDINENSYTYRVSTIDKCGDINPPSNIGASILLKQKIVNDNILLTWNAYKYWKTGVKNYTLQVQLRDRSYKTIAKLSDTTFLDDSVYHAIDTAYCYRVIAYENAPGSDSSVSNRTCAVLPSRIFIPNAFTPGNDSLNNTWKVSALSIYNAVGKQVKNYSVKIFNRWGTMVYESDDLNKGWDGTFKGVLVPSDVYIYLINAQGIDGKNLHLSGNITVIK